MELQALIGASTSPSGSLSPHSKKNPMLMWLRIVKAFQPPSRLLWELGPRWSEQITAASWAIHPRHFGRLEFPPNDKMTKINKMSQH